MPSSKSSRRFRSSSSVSRRQDDRNSAGLHNRVVVSGADERKRRSVLLGGTIVGIQPNQRFRSHTSTPFATRSLCRVTKKGQTSREAARATDRGEDRKTRQAAGSMPGSNAFERAGRQSSTRQQGRQALCIVPDAARLERLPTLSIPSWAQRRSIFPNGLASKLLYGSCRVSPKGMQVESEFMTRTRDLQWPLPILDSRRISLAQDDEAHANSATRCDCNRRLDFGFTSLRTALS